MVYTANKQASLETLNQQFESAHPREVLDWATEEYGDKLAIVTSFQPTGIVTIHMMQEIYPDISIITLDTGLLFPETNDLINQLLTDFHLNLISVQPELTLESQAQQLGDALWQHNPDLCCRLRKVHPLRRALKSYEAWMSGLRRDQSAKRVHTPIISWDSKNNVIKLCPLATWTEEMVWTYLKAYDLPYNSLHDHGYPSIGCITCTRAVNTGEDPRAGRWDNSNKTECGIHFIHTDQKQSDLTPLSREL